MIYNGEILLYHGVI